MAIENGGNGLRNTEDQQDRSTGSPAPTDDMTEEELQLQYPDIGLSSREEADINPNLSTLEQSKERARRLIGKIKARQAQQSRERSTRAATTRGRERHEDERDLDLTEDAQENQGLLRPRRSQSEEHRPTSSETAGTTDLLRALLTSQTEMQKQLQQQAERF